MPIYEYECKNCGNGFEFLFRPSDIEAECPICGTIHDKDERFDMSVSNFKIDMSNTSPY